MTEISVRYIPRKRKRKKIKPRWDVEVYGHVRTKRINWFHPNEPEYWSGSIIVLRTRNAKQARRMYNVVVLHQTNHFYRGDRVALFRYNRCVMERSI